MKIYKNDIENFTTTYEKIIRKSLHLFQNSIEKVFDIEDYNLTNIDSHGNVYFKVKDNTMKQDNKFIMSYGYFLDDDENEIKKQISYDYYYQCRKILLDKVGNLFEISEDYGIEIREKYNIKFDIYFQRIKDV